MNNKILERKDHNQEKDLVIAKHLQLEKKNELKEMQKENEEKFQRLNKITNEETKQIQELQSKRDFLIEKMNNANDDSSVTDIERSMKLNMIQTQVIDGLKQRTKQLTN